MIVKTPQINSLVRLEEAIQKAIGPVPAPNAGEAAHRKWLRDFNRGRILRSALQSLLGGVASAHASDLEMSALSSELTKTVLKTSGTQKPRALSNSSIQEAHRWLSRALIQYAATRGRIYTPTSRVSAKRT